MMNDYKMKLAQLNESMDMIMEVIEMNGDPELVERLEKLKIERDELIKRMDSLQ